MHKTPERALVNMKEYSQEKKYMNNICLQILSLANTFLNSKPYTVQQALLENLMNRL